MSIAYGPECLQFYPLLPGTVNRALCQSELYIDIHADAEETGTHFILVQAVPAIVKSVQKAPPIEGIRFSE